MRKKRTQSGQETGPGIFILTSMLGRGLGFDDFHGVSGSSAERPVGCRLFVSLVWTWCSRSTVLSKHYVTRILGLGCLRDSWKWTLDHGDVDVHPVQAGLWLFLKESIQRCDTPFILILLGFSGASTSEIVGGGDDGGGV